MLKEFFVNNNPGPNYEMFGFNHIITLLMPVILLILIYINRNKISNMKEKTKRRVLVTTATVMLLSQVIYLISNIYYGIFDYKIHLPFHLCFISNYMFIYGVYKKDYNFLKYTFFLSFIGPVPAILWPNLPSSFDYFKFYEYFISHHVFIVISLFSYYALNYKIKLNQIFKVLVFTNSLILIMMPFNKMYDMNYIYSSEIPEYIVKLYPFLNYITPIISLEVTGLIITILLYQLVRFRNKELNNV